jgi:hypothetical protein
MHASPMYHDVHSLYCRACSRDPAACSLSTKEGDCQLRAFIGERAWDEFRQLRATRSGFGMPQGSVCALNKNYVSTGLNVGDSRGHTEPGPLHGNALELGVARRLR